MRIVVIGAGFAGLLAAYRVAQAGHEVVVLEARNRVGGLADRDSYRRRDARRRQIWLYL